MDSKLHKTLIAVAIASLISAPAWAATHGAQQPEQSSQAVPGQASEAPEAPEAASQQPAEIPQAAPEQQAESPQGAPGQADPQMQAAPEMETQPEVATPDSSVTDNPLYSRTPDELRRAEVLDAAGEKVGKIKAVVLGPDRQSAHAVISSGGFLGLGAREMIVSLDELQVIEDKLTISATKEELEARGQHDEPERYVELEPDRPISEFSAFEPVPEGEGPRVGIPEPRAPQ